MAVSSKTISELLRALEQIGIPYAVGGSFASSLWGNPRQTLDIDVAVLIDRVQAIRLADALSEAYLLSRAEIEEAISGQEPFRSFQMLHSEELFKADIFVLGKDDYSEVLFGRRRRVEVSPGLQAFFCSPEDIVIAKLRWFVLGNRVSDRQWNDIVQVLENQASAIDVDYLRKWCVHFEVAAELDRAIAEAGL